ncbi:MAG: murein L,D-transpeptidase [Alphaproteobacteria bacterium]|nr:murein L,D-transpeptidase [Alphaproteobacteria bacterium]
MTGLFLHLSRNKIQSTILTTLTLCLSMLSLSACVTPNNTYSRHEYGYNKQLEDIREKNFSVLRTEMVMRGMSMDNPMYIRAFKSEMKLELWVKNSYRNEFELFRAYDVCSKSGALGPKIKEGDLQTPEGFYDVTQSRLNPNSKFFLSFNIGYPNQYDYANKRTGSALMIHGSCVSKGCLAMTNKNIAEIYLIIEQNFKYGHESIPIHIFPFQMTDKNMKMRRYSQWYSFWNELKKGYDYFEKHRIPPHVSVKNKRYIIDTTPRQYANVYSYNK